MKKSKIIVAIALCIVSVSILLTTFFACNKANVETETIIESQVETELQDVDIPEIESNTSTKESTVEMTKATTTQKSITTRPKTEKSEHPKPTTTNKQTITKPATTTQKTEPTTQKPKVLYVNSDGREIIEVYVNEAGNTIEVDTNGIGRVKTNVAPPDDDPRDGCPYCGKEDCGPRMESYYCVVCQKTISAHSCHPDSHAKKSES